MPLSEHEQKLLDQMERALYEEDPRFATQMKGSPLSRLSRRHVMRGALVALLGLALVVTGVQIDQIILGGIGFALMVAGVAWAATPEQQERPHLHAVGEPARAGSAPGATQRRGPAQARPAKSRSARPDGGFMQRLEGRWEERRRRDMGGW